MDSQSGRGDILLIADEGYWNLDRSLAAVGRRVAVLSCAEVARMDHGDTDDLDLLVTAFSVRDAESVGLFERLLDDALFRGVPRLHLCRDPRSRDELVHGRRTDPAHVLLLPEDEHEIEARARLLAEIGELRRERASTSIRDPLTGLHNRPYLMQRVEEEFSRARRYQSPLSLVLLDIDQLKRINDVSGVAVGDSAIRAVSRLVRGPIRKEDVVGRMGDESYAILLPGNRYRGAAVLANKIRTEVEQLLLPPPQERLRVRVSAGISTYPDNPEVESADDLIRTTEDALEEAKARGGNRVFIDEGALDRERRVILVADPDAQLVDLAEDLLVLDEYRVVRASSARSALETLRFRNPDLLILDLGLLEDEPEIDLLKRAGELGTGKRFPIVGLSRGREADPERLQRLGVDRLITKPFSVSILRGVVQELMEGARLARRSRPQPLA